MVPELRKTGITVIGEVPWGTHFCTFYETKQDLLDILVPFFKAGLEGKEFCLWIISNSELLTMQEATTALQKALPNLDRHVSDGHIELVDHDRWFLEGGAFDLYRVAHRFKEKLDAALAQGYVGMRLNGSPAWLYEEDDKKLIAFEEEADKLFRDLRLIASCTYPITESKAAEFLHVARAHQFVVTRRHGEWEVFETPELKQAKAEIKQLNEELEQRVIERTRELAAANEALRREIAGRRQAEDHFRLVIDTIPSLVNTTLPDGSLDFANRRWLEYLGVPLTDLLGWGWASIIHPADAGEAVSRWRAGTAAGEPFVDEARVRGADGEYRWFLTRSEPLRDEKGAIVKWYTSSLDIEDRKRGQEALRASEARLQAAVDAAAIGLWEWDLVSGRILGLAHHDKLFGFAPGEFDGSYPGFEKRVHPEDLEELNRIVQRARDESSEYVHEYRVIWPDGSIHWIGGRGRFVYNEAGQPIRMYGAVLDITERKRAEEQLRRAEEQARQVLDAIPEQIWSGPADGTLDYCNYQWRAYAGLRLEELQGDGWQRMLHPGDKDRVLKAWRESVLSGTPYEQEERHRGADNVYRWFLCRGVPLRDSEGCIERWYGANTDIEDRKLAEEQLKASTGQLRDLSASLQSAREEESTRIAREIHDELGGALTSLRWDLEEVCDIISQATKPAQFAVPRQRIEAMMTLTEATLHTVRRLSSELRPMVLDELGLFEAFEWQALQFQQRTGIAVQFECSVEKIDLNRGESTAVFRILQEALTNILRHAQATQVTITVKQEHGEFLLTVTDNGKGITEREKSDAHSLGLLGMRERAHLIGAKIDVIGMEGKGTLIALRVPIPESER